jgi:hypothetical protein
MKLLTISVVVAIMVAPAFAQTQYAATPAGVAQCVYEQAPAAAEALMDPDREGESVSIGVACMSLYRSLSVRQRDKLTDELYEYRNLRVTNCMRRDYSGLVDRFRVDFNSDDSQRRIGETLTSQGRGEKFNKDGLANYTFGDMIDIYFSFRREPELHQAVRACATKDYPNAEYDGDEELWFELQK